MIKIFLDDIRIPKDENWVLIKSYYDFVEYFNSIDIKDVDLISLDHDLGDIDSTNEKTGYHVAQWLVDYALDHGGIDLPIIQCHSANPVGANKIIGLVNGYLISNNYLTEENKNIKKCISCVVELKRGIVL